MRKSHSQLAIFLTVSFAGLAGCVGNLAGNALSAGDDWAQGPGGEGPSGVGGTSPIANRSAGAVQMRHLLKREMVQAYAEILGPTPSVDWNAIGDDSTLSSFDNDIDLQSLNASQVQSYLQVAEQAANDVVINGRALKTFGCTTTNLDKACVSAFVARFGLRIYRRPLTDDEKKAYLALWSSEADPIIGGRQVVRAFLAAPNFLYQPEIGTQKSDKVGYIKLTAYERATRLALLITGSVPDDALLQDAGGGALDTAEGVGQVADRLLKSTQGQTNLRSFARGWLGIMASAGTPVSPQNYPHDSAQLRQQMSEETLRVFDDFAKPGQYFPGMLNANYTYVTASTAPLYGVAAPPEGTWSKISLEGSARLGILTQPALLYATAGAGSAVVNRGKYVRLRLLCQSIGAPPANAANAMLGGDGDGAERQGLNRHLADPSCSACHQLMDPIGNGFEQYDRIGNFRTQGADGQILTGAGQVYGDSGYSFVGAAELGSKLSKDPLFTACIGRKLAQYLLGHVPTEKDAGTVALLSQAIATSDLPTAVQAYVQSDAFLYRRIDAAAQDSDIGQ